VDEEVPVFEGLRRRAEPEIPPWREPVPEPAYRPDRIDQEVYHVSRAADAGLGADLDPQRLDGRSLTGPLPVRSRTAPRTRQPKAAQPDQALHAALADFLSSRAAGPAPAPVRVPPPRQRHAAARTPRTFLFHRLFSEAELAGLEVETRPSRGYPVRWPGSTGERRIRPEYHAAGITPASARMRTRGLALMFPPHTVHARRSPSPRAGGTCELIGTDHVHIRQAVVPPDDALRSGAVHEVLARAAPGEDNTPVVHDLRKTLGEDATPPGATCAASLHRATTVRLGDDTLTRLDCRYVVERTAVPAGALLAADWQLARRYVDLVAGPAEPGALADFLTDLLGAAANTRSDNVLGYADGLPERPGTLLGLFGMVPVDPATGVLVDAGRPHPELDLQAPAPARDPA
jgi:hypothetical protein